MASQDRYPYLAYCSLEFIALSCPHGCTKCWFIRVSNLLESTYTSMDRLLPFKYSMDAPGHLLHTRQELKRILLDDIYRHYVGHLNKPSRQVTSELHPKMTSYAQHFIKVRDGLSLSNPHIILVNGRTLFLYP